MVTGPVPGVRFQSWCQLLLRCRSSGEKLRWLQALPPDLVPSRSPSGAKRTPWTPGAQSIMGPGAVLRAILGPDTHACRQGTPAPQWPPLCVPQASLGLWSAAYALPYAHLLSGLVAPAVPQFPTLKAQACSSPCGLWSWMGAQREDPYFLLIQTTSMGL